MKYDLLTEIKKATQEYYSDPQLMSEFEVEQHIYDCICGLVEKLVSQKTADTETILNTVKETIADGQLMSMEEFTEKELQKHYNKNLTVPLIVGLINNIEQYYPADVFVSGAGAMARHVLKLFKQELILACNIEDSRFTG